MVQYGVLVRYTYMYIIIMIRIQNPVVVIPQYLYMYEALKLQSI